MDNLSAAITEDGINYQKIHDLITTIYYSTGLTGIFVDNSCKITESNITYNIFTIFPDLMDEFSTSMKTNVGPQTYFYIFTTSYKLSFMIAVLRQDTKYYGSFIFGPFSLTPLTNVDFKDILLKKSVSVAKIHDLKDIFSQSQVIKSSRIYYLEKAIYALIYSNLDFQITDNVLKTDCPNPEKIDYQELIRIDPTTKEYDYALEQIFFSRISSGDLDEVLKMFRERIKVEYLSILGSDKIDDFQANAIVYCTLLSRAAIAGGVEPNKSLTLAEKYMNYIKSSNTFEDLNELVESMTIMYTNSVLSFASASHVDVIKQATRYIHNHLSEVIKLSDIADYVGLSPNYFSSLFKTEMGVALAEYINNIRIKESLYLLQNSSHSIVEIAIKVGFSNQNYFTTVFKKVTGITPKQYRIRSIRSNINL